MLICESKNINKNPRYKIIKYKNEFLMVDVTSSWIFFFIPMLNWGVPKKYAKISQSEFEELNTFTPKNSSSAGWIAGGGSVLLAVLTRKYIQLLNIQVNQIAVNILCCLVLLGVFLSALYINSKSKLNVYDRNNCDEKIILIPTFKNLYLMLLSYIIFGGLSILAFYNLKV
ncbi:tandem five-TM family protein [Staphylococcus aureus]|nr:tandem five-TM family protein [Staphylococcus aureus]